MSAVDLLGRKISPADEKTLEIYKGLKELLEMPDLSPCVASNARVALGAVWQIVNDQDLDFEYLYEYKV